MRYNALGLKNTYNPNVFDFIWASPPCAEYSIANTTVERNLKPTIHRKRTIDIDIYLDPKHWIIENTQQRQLGDQDFMHDLPFTDID